MRKSYINSFLVFVDYFNSKLKTRMLEHVIRPSRQGTNTRLWTNSNGESMNHRFKISTDWKPQRLPELVNTIHDIVRLHFANLKRALFGQGNYELECAFQHLYVPHTVWTSKTTTEKEKIFARFLKNRNLNAKMIQSSDGKLTVPNVKRLARKPGQRHRPKTVAAMTISHYT